MGTEIWKAVAGYNGIYEVSNFGRVKSLFRLVRVGIWKREVKEKFLKSSLDTDGYPIVCLSKDGATKIARVHMLVAISFLNHMPNELKMDVDHINGIKSDPRSENLRIVTHRFNCTFGERKYKKRLTSQYPGVSWRKDINKWRSETSIDGKKKRLGLFENEIDAANAYQDEFLKIDNR